MPVLLAPQAAEDGAVYVQTDHAICRISVRSRREGRVTIELADLPALRTKLLERLATLRELQGNSAESRRPVELDQTSVGRLSRVDALQRQAMALEVERRRDREKLRIEAALKRIDANEFGLCVVCGDGIGARRLSVDLTLPTCIRCASGGAA